MLAPALAALLAAAAAAPPEYVPLPRRATPAAPQQDPPPPPREPAAAPQEDPPPPRRGAPREELPQRVTSREQVPSLLSGEPLGHGNQALLVGAGFPFLVASWAQGVSGAMDLGAQVELDWITAEFFGGGTIRRVFHRAGSWAAAWRGRLGLYANGGADWSVRENRSGSGLQVAPGVVASRGAPRGTWSFSADLPLAITLQHGGGFIAAPRAAVAFETPLFGDLSAGARLGAFWHVANREAPLAGHPRGAAELTGVLTWRIF